MLQWFQNFLTAHPYIGGLLCLVGAGMLVIVCILIYLTKINPPQIVDENERPIPDDELDKLH